MDTCVHWLGIWRLNSVWALDTWIRSTGNILLMEMTWLGSAVESITYRADKSKNFFGMASNVGEMSGMKDARHMILWLFFGLLPMLGSCDFRDMLDDYPVSGVQIKLDWKGVTDKLPQTMRIIFYPKDTQGRKVESYLPAGGGEVKVPSGKYAVVAYNFNTESIQIRGDESYETIEAFTGHCMGLDVHEDMVWSPDPLYVVALERWK